MLEMKEKLNLHDVDDKTFHAFYQNVLTYAQVFFSDKSLLEDVVQDAFAVLLQKSYDEMNLAAMFSFLCRCLENFAKQERYKAEKRRTVALEDVIDQVADTPSDSEEKLFDTLVYHEYCDFLEKELSAQDWTLLLLCEKHEKVAQKIKAIMEYYNISEFAARMRFTRLRQRVHTLLNREYGLNL